MPTVLFVEDDPLVMLSAATALEDHGWIVKKAANGVVAMERLPELCLDVDVMVVDIRLGQGPSGWEVARYARSVNIDMPVAYITGDDGVAGASDERVEGGVVLRKPVTEQQLLAALGALIADGVSAGGTASSPKPPIH